MSINWKFANAYRACREVGVMVERSARIALHEALGPEALLVKQPEAEARCRWIARLGSHEARDYSAIGAAESLANMLADD